MRGWGGVALLVLAACGGQPAKQKCEVDRNCVEGYQCVAGFCEPNGGTGGGTGGGVGGGGGDAGMGGGGGGVNCPATCPPGYLCDGTSNGECTLRVTGLRFVTPDAGTTVGPNTSLFLAVVADTSAGVTLPQSISLTADNGAYAPTTLNLGTTAGQYEVPSLMLAMSATTGPTTLTATMVVADGGVS